MGDYWSGTTRYDLNKGNRDREAAVAEAAKRNETDGKMNNTLYNPGQQFDLYGNSDQQAETQAQLSQVGAMTGQGVFQSGQQQQDYYNSLQNRREGKDTASAFLKDQNNRNKANVARTYAGRGIAGGVAASSMNQADMQADSMVADKMQGYNAKNDQELWNYVKRNQKVTGEALAQGADKGLASGMDTSQASGIFGSVICTELNRQGILDNKTYIADSTFGWALSINDPFAYYGYNRVAIHLVPLMQKSPLVTKALSLLALPWANHMAGRENLTGKLLLKFGIPFCRIVGKLIVRFEVKYAV